MKKGIAILFTFVTITTVIFAGNLVPNKSDYPHWNFNNQETYQKLVKINNFIERNRDKNLIAVFDWDGTLYNEHIPVKELNDIKYAGQPAYYMWGAYNSQLFDFKIFPLFWTKDGDFRQNVILKNNYLEEHANVKPDGYSKFTQTDIFTAGMTIEEVNLSANKFLAHYKPENYAYLPMLDIVQKMENSGYNTWIVTGSSQYFVGCILDYIQKNIDYKLGEKYNFSKILSSTKYSSMHIAGNALKIMDDNRFSVVYDNTFTDNKNNELLIVDKSGKEIVVKNIEKWENSKALFIAGNSDGDLYDSRYIIKNKDAFGIEVNPVENSKLMKFSKEHPEQIVILNNQEL